MGLGNNEPMRRFSLGLDNGLNAFITYNNVAYRMKKLHKCEINDIIHIAELFIISIYSILQTKASHK